MSGDSKKAFNTAHTSIPVFYPDELSIVGGRDHIADPRERGPLDTSKPTAPDNLYRPQRLEMPLKLGFVQSIDARGVMQAISIIKRGNVPTVEYGQCRTRAARAANHDRKEKCGMAGMSDRAADSACALAGLPLRRIRCDGKTASTEVEVLARMLSENHQRHSDDIETTLTLLARFLDETEQDFELAGQAVGLGAQAVRNLMKFHTNATPETRKMVKAGRVSISAAAFLCREADPEAQNKLLAELLAAAAPTVHKARQISKRTDKPSSANPFHGKKDLVKFKGFVEEQGGKNQFIAGVLAMLSLQTTGKADDERLAEIFAKFEG